MIKEATLDFEAPITAPSFLELDGVLAFSLHNAGTATVTLGGLYTLKPGSTYNSGMPAANVVISDKVRVAFSDTGTRRLEISMVRMKGGAFSNYEQKAL